MVDKKAGLYGFGYTVTEKATFFYDDESLIASTNSVWLKWGFHVLI